MKRCLMAKAMYKIRCNRYNFYWSAYVWAEEPMPSGNEILYEAENMEPEFHNPILENYVLDVLAGRAKPLRGVL